jgi:hypothetical protein
MWYNDLFKEIINNLTMELNANVEVLSRGMQTHSDYDGLVGKIRGYRESITVIEELRDLINKQEEEN